jgi:hypothetical protein
VASLRKYRKRAIEVEGIYKKHRVSWNSNKNLIKKK